MCSGLEPQVVLLFCEVLEILGGGISPEKLRNWEQGFGSS